MMQYLSLLLIWEITEKAGSGSLLLTGPEVFLLTRCHYWTVPMYNARALLLARYSDHAVISRPAMTAAVLLFGYL